MLVWSSLTAGLLMASAPAVLAADPPSNSRGGGSRAGHSAAANDEPQPASKADFSGRGANRHGEYDSTRDGTRADHGGGRNGANKVAGEEGKADNKNPPGQAPNGSDHNNGYECDGNQGVGRGNPAHSGCRTATPPPGAGGGTGQGQTDPPGNPTKGNPTRGDAKPGDAEPGNAKPGNAKPGDPKPGNPTRGNARPGRPNPGNPKPGRPNPGDPNPRDPNPGNVNPSNTNPGNTNLGNQPGAVGGTQPVQGQGQTGAPGNPNPERLEVLGVALERSAPARVAGAEQARVAGTEQARLSASSPAVGTNADNRARVLGTTLERSALARTGLNAFQAATLGVLLLLAGYVVVRASRRKTGDSTESTA